MHRYTGSKESNGPSLVYSSVESSPATWPLPSTPVDKQAADPKTAVTATALPNAALQHSGTGIEAFCVPWLSDGSVGFDNWVTLQDDQTNKRHTPADFDYPPESSTKAIRLTHHSTASLSSYLEGEQADVVCGEPHLDLGRKAGRFWCSCGKTYSTAFRLRAHISDLNSKPKYACATCGQKFTRDDVRQRHEDNTHKDKKVACPGCNKLFRNDYLRVHLANDTNTRCKLIVEAMHIRTTQEPKVDLQDISHEYWEQDEQSTMSLAGDKATSNAKENVDELGLEIPSSGIKPASSAPTRPIHRRTREPCDLCHEPLGPSEEDLVAHIARHNIDFMDKKLKCEECQISFMYQADLDRHLQAAARGSCGFKFEHNAYHWNTIAKRHGWNKQAQCTGHHPPPYVKPFAPSDHELMQERLWEWELSQIRAHRTTIARLLAERIAFTQPGHMSLTDHELSCMTVASRFSITSRNSVRSVPAYLQYEDKIDMDQVASDFDCLVTDDNSSSANNVSPDPIVAKPRPESTIFTVPVSSWPKRALSARKVPQWATSVPTRYLERVNILRKPQEIFSKVVNNEPSIRYSGHRKQPSHASSRLLLSNTS